MRKREKLLEPVVDLDSLSLADKRRLRDTLNVELAKQSRRVPKEDYGSFERYVWNALCHALRFHTLDSDDGLLISAVVNTERNGVPRRTYETICRNLSDYIDRHCGNVLKLAEQAALLDVMFECLFERLRAAGYVINHKSMLDRINELPEALDAGFPGYAAAGRLDWIPLRAVKQLVN